MLAITNAKVFPVDAPVIEKGSILIDGGKIVKVGANIDIPAEAEVIDAGGRSVYPGFIDAHCHVGMWESAIGFEGDDVNEMTDPVTPHIKGHRRLQPHGRDREKGLPGRCNTGGHRSG